MPSFDDIEITVLATMSFEVFCAECGEGLCGLSDTRKSRQRGAPQVSVGNCPKCIERETEPLRERIEELEQQLKELEEQTT